MEDYLKNLEQDRFLRKDPNQSNQTKGAAYAALNPAPKRGDDSLRKAGRPKGSEEDGGAPNVLTGTVITSCFIQTSALPSRIELQGNDLTFFDDTTSHLGSVEGDTSRLIFTHGSGKLGEVITQGFILEKRASTHNTYDNVLSLYALPAKSGAHNYMFIGREGRGLNRNLGTLRIAVNEDSKVPALPADEGVLNGVFAVEFSVDGEDDPSKVMLYAGASRSISQGGIPDGFSSFLIGGDGGLSGLGYRQAASPHSPLILLYILDETKIMLGADLIPDATGAYDIGSPTAKIGTLYGSVVACPLPTVEGSALEVLGKIEAPVLVGDRGHYGDGKYYDDLTFPPELLFTDSKGRTEIEHTKMIGFLLQAVIELKAEVDFLKANR